MVFFEAPHRLADMLAALADGLGDARAAAVCREMTKTYEEVRRGGLRDLALWAAGGVRGETTGVVAGASADDRRESSGLQGTADWIAAVEATEAAGVSRREAIAEVARRAGVPKREVYDAVVKASSPRK